MGREKGFAQLHDTALADRVKGRDYGHDCVRVPESGPDENPSRMESASCHWNVPASMWWVCMKGDSGCASGSVNECGRGRGHEHGCCGWQMRVGEHMMKPYSRLLNGAVEWQRLIEPMCYSILMRAVHQGCGVEAQTRIADGDYREMCCRQFIGGER
jgi:hypothetical protein